MKILVSIGALIGRATGMDYKQKKSFAPRLECDGFEFMIT